MDCADTQADPRLCCSPMTLTLCILGMFACLLAFADLCFQNHLFKTIFQKYHQSVKQFRSNSGGLYLGSNRLQRLQQTTLVGKELTVVLFHSLARV